MGVGPIGTRPGYRAEIDGLRALAVAAVVFSHAGLGVPGGFIGVDVFFVISGYLIIRQIHDALTEGRFSFTAFYARRVRRLFPALAIVLAATTAWAVTHELWIDLKPYGASLVATVTCVSNFYFRSTTNYFARAASTHPLLHGWSLSVEEQFYLLAPLCLWLLVRRVDRRWHVTALAVTAIVSLIVSLWWGRVSPTTGFYLLPSRAWELALGGIVALWQWPAFRLRWIAEVTSLLGLAAIVAAAFLLSPDVTYPSWRALIPALGAAALLAPGDTRLTVAARALSLRPAVWLGKISYALYLWHWPLLVALAYGQMAPVSIAARLAAVALAVVLAALTTLLIEAPIRFGGLLRDRRTLFAAAAGTGLLFAAIGSVLIASNGLHRRQARRFGAMWARIMPLSDCPWMTVESARSDALCRRGAAGVAPSVILIGDSHAGAIGAGLFEAARRHGVAGFEFTAPGWLPGNPALAADPVDGRLSAALVETLRRHPELRRIIVAQFWEPRISGARFRDNEPLGGDEAVPLQSMSRSSTAKALGWLFDRFPDRRFILLDDNPNGRALDTITYMRYLADGGRTPATGLPRAAADAQLAFYQPVLQSLAAGHRNVTYAPLLHGLCDARTCPLFDSRGYAMYRDGEHLTQDGSLDAAPLFEPLFEPPVATSAPKLARP